MRRLDAERRDGWSTYENVIKKINGVMKIIPFSFY